MTGLQEYKCPACGGAVEFHSGVQKMKCQFCDTEFEMEALKELDEEFKNEEPESLEWTNSSEGQWQEGEIDNIKGYVCKSCGGEIIGDENTAATSCPFCGNPVVMMGQFSGSLRPDYVIPFKCDKKMAKESLMKHVQGKRFVPKIFKDENHIDEIKGIYVPFWLFDADVEANIHYDATTIRSWSDKDYNYTETNYYSVSRGGNISFNQVPVDGSSKIDDKLMESIEPFDFLDLKEFQTAYLAGYVADKYDVTVEESIERANQRIRYSTESEFGQTVKGYDTVEAKSSNLRLYDGSYKYALYPVWILNTSWNNNNYMFAMNGQTGKFVGDLPVDRSALMKLFIILSIAFGAGIYALLWLIILV